MAAAVLAPGVSGQGAPKLAKFKSPQTSRERIDKVDHAERLARIALTGDLGLPTLPPVYWDSPRDDLVYADRFPFGEQAAGPADGGTPAALDGFIPSGASGTGTTIPEIFKYLLPAGYETYQSGLPEIPLVIAYHGYGASANSVALLSTVDDECYARGWAYFSPTGMDDQLFGSPGSQKNTEAALNWMLNNFNIDRDRIYAVGFSMGGGIMTNFAARHRDPDGNMIAALGVVSGSMDWTMSWKLGNATIRTLLQNSFNFGGPPNNASFAFGYQRASALYYSFSAYPPLTPSVLPIYASSLATNLAPIPTYIVWDTGDTTPEVVAQEAHFNALRQSLGGIVDYHTVSGTINPANGQPAPHSWLVLDEAALFDFFEGKVVERSPSSFHALMADSGDVAWLSLEQRFTEAFSLIDGVTDPGLPSVQLSNVLNASTVQLDMNVLGYSAGNPVRINAGTTSGNFDLALFGFDDPPAYLIDADTGDLVTGTESDPQADTLIQDISATAGVDAIVVTDAAWTTDLYTAQNPAALGGPLALTIDAPDTSAMVLLFIGFTEALGTVPGGNTITLALGPPTIYLALPLDLNGDANLGATMPTTPALSGLTLLLQTIGISGTGGGVDSISNLWALHVE